MDSSEIPESLDELADLLLAAKELSDKVHDEELSGAIIVVLTRIGRLIAKRILSSEGTIPEH